jgi:hypothetical protein
LEANLKLLLIALAAAIAVSVVGCSSSDDVVDRPPPVTATDKNKFETSIDKGPTVSEDGAGRSKSALEGTG